MAPVPGQASGRALGVQEEGAHSPPQSTCERGRRGVEEPGLRRKLSSLSASPEGIAIAARFLPGTEETGSPRKQGGGGRRSDEEATERPRSGPPPPRDPRRA